MYEPSAEEAHAADVVFTLTWRDRGGSLTGELDAENVSGRTVHLSGKPDLTPLRIDGAPLPVQTVVTLEFMPPGYVSLGPGERARAPVAWAAWDGDPASGRFIVRWPGGAVEVTAAGPAQPAAAGPPTNLSSSWFQRLS